MEIVGYKEKSLLVFERGDKKLTYDFRDNKFRRIYKSVERETTSAQSFFRGVTYSQIARVFRDREYGEFIKMIQRAEHRCSNVATLLERIAKYAHLEQYLVLGVKLDSYYSFSKPVAQFNKEVLAFMKESQISFARDWESAHEKNPEIFNNICSYVRKNYFMDLEVYRKAHELLTGYGCMDKFKKLIAPVTEEVERASRWANNNVPEMGYGYEYKTLFEYLLKRWRFEATPIDDSLMFLRDYAKMQRAMGKTSAEKYPKYLRIIHDLVTRNYEFWKEDYDTEVFKANVDFSLEYAWGGYKMVAPKTPKDVKEEGTNLNHCVGSYIDKIIDGTTQILFMRDSDEEEKSLVTVEIRLGNLSQARGHNNRQIDDAERKWLKTYCKSKKVKLFGEQVWKDEEEATEGVASRIAGS